MQNIPEFDMSLPTEISVQLGKDVRLPCKVKNLRNKKVRKECISDNAMPQLRHINQLID